MRKWPQKHTPYLTWGRSRIHILGISSIWKRVWHEKVTPKAYSISHMRKVPDPYFGNIFYLKTGLTLKKIQESTNPQIRKVSDSYFGNIFYLKPGLTWESNPENPPTLTPGSCQTHILGISSIWNRVWHGKVTPRIHQPLPEEALKPIFWEYLLFETGFDMRKVSNPFLGIYSIWKRVWHEKVTPKEYSISQIRKVPDPYFGNIFYLKTGLTLKNPRIHQPSNQEGLRSIFREYLLFENGFDIGKYPQESTNPHTRKLSNSYFGNIFYLKTGLTWESDPKRILHISH